MQEQLQGASLGKVELTALRSTEARIRDLSTRLELELAMKTRLESTLDRLRDQLRESEQVRLLSFCFLLYFLLHYIASFNTPYINHLLLKHLFLRAAEPKTGRAAGHREGEPAQSAAADARVQRAAF